MEQQTKEVYFDQYCKTCQHEELLEDNIPCRECLEWPYNYDSHKPVNWVGKEGQEDYVAPERVPNTWKRNLFNRRGKYATARIKYQISRKGHSCMFTARNDSAVAIESRPILVVPLEWNMGKTLHIATESYYVSPRVEFVFLVLLEGPDGYLEEIGEIPLIEKTPVMIPTDRKLLAKANKISVIAQMRPEKEGAVFLKGSTVKIDKLMISWSTLERGEWYPYDSDENDL